MKDIGLGILDPYTVVIVLITLVLSQVLFGYQIPLDTSNATQLFVSLVVFTGYVYAARSLLRLPVAMIQSWMLISEKYPLPRYLKWQSLKKQPSLLMWFELLWVSIGIYWAYFVYWLTQAFNFTDGTIESPKQHGKLESLQNNAKIVTTLGVLDRVCVILISIFASIQGTSVYVQFMGVSGIFLMALIFLFKGNFSALIKDELIKSIQKKDDTNKLREQPSEQKASTSTTPQLYTQRRGGVYIEVSYCMVCGKLCSMDRNGKLPKVCSLECRQKWFTSWEKDWCIRNGKERELLNQLRNSEYQDLYLVTETINTYTKLATEESIWALLAMIRDAEGIPYINILYYVDQALERILTEKKFAADILAVCIYDENINIVTTALRLLSELPNGYVIDFSDLTKYLKIYENRINVYTIRILGKLGQQQALVEYLEDVSSTESEISEAIDALAKMTPPAVRGLERLQRHSAASIRNASTEALARLGVNFSEPDLVVEVVCCPRCGRRVKIDIPKGNTIKMISKASLLQKLFLTRNFVYECPKCVTDIHIRFGKPVQTEMFELMRKSWEIRESLYHLDPPLDDGSYRL